MTKQELMNSMSEVADMFGSEGYPFVTVVGEPEGEAADPVAILSNAKGPQGQTLSLLHKAIGQLTETVQ